MAIFILLMVFFFISTYGLITLLLDSVKTGKRITSERIEEIIKGDVGFKVPDLKKSKRGKKKIKPEFYIYIQKSCGRYRHSRTRHKGRGIYIFMDSCSSGTGFFGI